MPGTRHIKRDLSEDAIPHLDHGTFQTFLDPAAALTPAQKTGLALSDTLVAELKEADLLVLGAPMYNLMVPSTLKSWIDHVSRVGQTFQFTEAGPVGLLKGKKAYVAIAQGGKFLGTPADLETGYLRMVLGLMGIKDIDFIHAEGLALGPEAAAAGLEAAHGRITDLCRSELEEIGSL
ncbi:MAG: NAD(P)H-dependent oxidoreductase [Rhodospirillales bacterium]|nr:NAD(P)H-dependent oxidoreductase [Rhodospirillales bacterium]